MTVTKLVPLLTVLLIAGCTCEAVARSAEGFVPIRFGPLQLLEAVSDTNCYAVAFKAPELSQPLSTDEVIEGDSSRRTDSSDGFKTKYQAWAQLQTPVVTDTLSYEARTRDTAFQCGGGLSKPYKEIVEGHGSTPAEYSYARDGMTMLVVDAANALVIALHAQ